MVYNKSGVERSSIENIDAATDRKVVRVGVNRLHKAASSLLVEGEHDSRVQIGHHILSVQKHVCLASFVALVPRSLWASASMFLRLTNSSRLVCKNCY